MKAVTALAAEALGRFLTNDFRRTFGMGLNDHAERLGSFARSTIECLGRSDALYHNFEHTVLVSLCGRDILQGRMLTEHIESADYSHLIVACLLHDIGYVGGVLKGDSESRFVVDESGETITLPRGASDAALAPYRVERSKLFVFERLRNLPRIDINRVVEAIEFTRFPIRSDREVKSAGVEPKLVQAADLIGLLGDPLYPRKANALFCEFEEIGINSQLGCSTPADLLEKYPPFFWKAVSPHIDEGINCLNLTMSGRQ